MNLATWLMRRAALTPDAPALLIGDQLLCTYAGLRDRVLSLAGALVSRGVEPGDRVLLWMGNGPAYLEVLQAIWAAGAVAVPINHKLHRREAADMIADCEPRLVIVRGDAGSEIGGVPTLDVGSTTYAAMVQSASIGRLVERRDDDLAWLFYTSGTTGRPKGAMLSIGNLSAMAHAYLVDVDPAAATRAMLYAAPLSHGAGLYSLPQMLVGAPHVITASGKFDPAEILELGRSGALPPLSLFVAPTMVRRLVETCAAEGGSGEGIATIVYGGGPMYRADIERAVTVMGNRFVQIYGQGETPMTIAYLARANVEDRTHAKWRERLQSVGMPHSCIAVKVLDVDGNPLLPGATGEIVVAGPTVMQGYWRDAAASGSAIISDWLRTGDVGFLDPDGFLTLTDRSKDVIISGGTNIYPREVEEVLLAHPGVAEASVIGEPDAEWGENVVAFVHGGHRGAGGRGDARRPLPGASGGVQAPQGVPLRRRTTEERLRQGLEERLAKAVTR